MPWKNGGGETVEIAVFPEGAGLDDFHWRLSTARVTSDGPFSTFPGVDRTLSILDGEGLELSIGNGPPVRRRREDQPAIFPGDQPTRARLLAGPVTDLNIMTRRNLLRHTMRRVTFPGSSHFDLDGDVAIVFCADGTLQFADGTCLAAGDSLILRGTDGRPETMTSDERATVYLIEIARPDLKHRP